MPTAESSPSSSDARPSKPRTALVWGLLVVNCWWWMQIVHELGHVIVAVTVGARLQQVVLPTLSISRSDVEPHPLAVWIVWGGPLLGVLAPWAAFAVAHWRRWWVAPELRFFAGFCWIANGAYLAAGSLDGIGDAGTLRSHGVPVGWLILWGLAGCGIGLFLWHRLGPQLGWSSAGLTRPRQRLQLQLGLSLTALLVHAFSWLASR